MAASMKAQGQLQPVIFRMENGKPGILLGQRRRGGSLLLEKDDPDFRLNGIEVDVDDAQARSISLTENMSQSPMTEVDIWKSLSNLIKQGWTIESISQVYTIPEKKVRQLLALGDCLVAVLSAYEKQDINLDGLKLLAMAPKKKVTEWLKLYRSGDEYPSWCGDIQRFLFNANKTFDTSVAIFDVSDSGLAVIEDMFKEKEVFANSAAFWEKQQEAIKTEIEKLKNAGWADAVIVDSFYSWEYVECKKGEGGKVFIEAEHDGKIVFHKGFLTKTEFKKSGAGDTKSESGNSDNDDKPEITNSMNDYLLLYLTQASRTSIQQNTKLAKQVIITLLLTRGEDLRLSGDHSFESVSKSNDSEIESTQVYKQYVTFRRDMLKSLKIRADWKYNYVAFDTVFKKILKLDTKRLDTVLAVLTADLITVHGSANLPIVKLAKPNMSNFWSAEQGGVFFKKIRNKQSLLSIIESEFDQDTVVQCESLKVIQIREKFKTMTEKVKDWVPKYLLGGWYGTGKGTPFKK